MRRKGHSPGSALIANIAIGSNQNVHAAGPGRPVENVWTLAGEFELPATS